MASDGKKAKTDSAPKKETLATGKNTSGTDVAKASEAPKTDTPKTEAAKTDAAKTETPKAEAGETTGAVPKNYSRGEGQKPVTQAYKDNWNAIFGDRKKKR